MNRKMQKILSVLLTICMLLPTEKSPVWNGPVEVGDAEVVKARTFYLDAESLISQLTL